MADENDRIPVDRGFLQGVLDHVVEGIGATIGGQQKRILELETAIGKRDEMLASFERRASRHAEHLARLEDRLRAIETGGPR